jgi:hypothetical protein
VQLRAAQTEEDLIEPLSTYFEYAAMQTSSSGGEVVNDEYVLSESDSKALAPKLLLGTHTRDNTGTTSSATIETSKQVCEHH